MASSMTMLIPEDTRQRQIRATDPNACVWVSANAGSGKTFVLSRRVLRLLLADNDPASILCLTFTKTAANEMAGRVFDELARWTTLSNSDLEQSLVELTGDHVTEAQRIFARQLFARALETPGGLKVQTIHAFCEKLLQQFPLEANVPGHFEVLDEEMANMLLTEAKSTTMQRVLDRPCHALHTAFHTLIALKNDQAIDQAIETLLKQRQAFADMTRHYKTIDEAMRSLKVQLALNADDSFDQLVHDLIFDENTNSQLGRSGLLTLKHALKNSDKKGDCDLSARIDHMLQATSALETIEAWIAIFAKKDSQPRALERFASKNIREAHPELFLKIEHEFARLSAVIERFNALRTLQASSVLFIIAQSILTHYLTTKNQRGLLDYDDLIMKTERLLTRSQAALWVQYKLDMGLSHILVDEAQDTSPAQWRVINALSDAFFHDISSQNRTIFAVGDEKQSIYSFQGAAPDQFDQQRRAFAKKSRQAHKKWHDITLNLSFRSTQDVLSAVDQVFADPNMRASVSTMDISPHQAYRRNSPGKVQLWPLIKEQDYPPPDDWRQPVDQPTSALEQLSAHIAAQIRNWIKTGAKLADGRTITAGDCLILLRKRGNLMGLINKALQRAGIPVAGMDRLALNAHIAVQDLKLLGEVMLLPDDDLALACLLKSPFFNLTDDDLLQLAPRRNTTLISALSQSAHPHHQSIYQTLRRWLKRVDYESPYVFFAHILSADGGRKKLLHRLGAEANDMIDTFLDQALDYEAHANDVSLQGFIAWLSGKQSELKREIDADRDETRVMTVHGAKGLEAPIVFLVDDGSQPFAHSHQPTIFSLYPDNKPTPLMFWGAQAKHQQTHQQQHMLQKNKKVIQDEHHRLLYVAMTRAQDQLIICGHEKKSGLSKDNWYRLIEKTLRPHMHPVYDQEQQLKHYVWEIQRSKQASQNSNVVKTKSHSSLKPVSLPSWVQTPFKEKIVSPRMTSASQWIEDDEISSGQSGPVQNSEPATPAIHHSIAKIRGQAIHTLLQYLPTLPPDKQSNAAYHYLEHIDFGNGHMNLPNLTDNISACVFNVLNAPELAYIFGPQARAEISISGSLDSYRGAIALTGRIDRLCQTSDGFLIIDFKTTQTPPHQIEDTPKSYLQQVMLYRALVRKTTSNQPVHAAILWTEQPWLMHIPDSLLDKFEKKLLKSQ